MPPSPPPGFTGQRSHVLATAVDGAHTVTLAWYTFPGSVALVPYVELSESHDGARPGRVMALSTLVHLAQNVGEDEVWQIGGRETPGPRATLAAMALPTLEEHTAAGYAAALNSAGAWNALASTQRTAVMARERYTLDYLAGGAGRAAGTIYLAGPTDPLPVAPGP